MAERRVVLGCDHAGVRLKNRIKEYLKDRGYEVVDVGADGDESVDYPDYASVVARKVSRGEAERGILVCGSGVGMAIVANKYPGVRAVHASDVATAEVSRRHNDTNVLALGARFPLKDPVEEIVRVWLEAEFEGGRHERRLNKIKKIESSLNGGDE